MTDAKEALYVSRIRQLLRHAHGRRNAITLERTVIPLLEALGHKPTLGRVQDFNQRKDRNCV